MQQISELIEAKVLELFAIEARVDLTRPEEQYGDFATNIALQIAKQLNKNPREIADEIASSLHHDEIFKAEVAGPGFINITLSDQGLLRLANQETAKGREGAVVVIETNNPNPFKAMHIGHAFNSILGDTLANFLEASGAITHRVSYHGDIGLHVGKSMYSLLRFVEGDAGKLDTVRQEDRNSFISRMYAEGSQAYKEDPSAKAEIDELTKQSFTREDTLYSAVYQKVFDWSFEQIDINVARLGNKPIKRRFLESEAESSGVSMVRDNVPDVFQESDGALVFKGSEHGSFDNVFVSSRGTGLYAARDLGLIKLKNEQFHPRRSYIVTAEEQRSYFVGVIAAAELCLPDTNGQTLNISTGTVKLSTGKMSSRDGEVVEISWLFDQIAEAIRVRGGEPDEALIAGVLRYEFLKVRIGSDVVFDVNEAVSLQGNSGPYLQYAHARARSILSKKEPSTDQISELSEGERSLVRKISEYNVVVIRSIEELMPHHIANYLYELAQEFNRFYENNRVIDDGRQDVRLNLVNKYANTLKNGLDLLGIYAPESM